MPTIRIAAVGTASPPLRLEQSETAGLLSRRFREQLRRRSARLLDKVFAHPSIRSRRFAAEDAEQVLSETPDERIERFARWGVELSGQALARALDEVRRTPGDLTALLVNTCTGYVCPGLSTYLLERFDLPRTTPVYDLVGHGCGGALPNLELAKSLAGGAGGGLVASVSVEVCSATFQMGDEDGLIISNALFADGASAMLLWDRPGGLELVASTRWYAPEHREAIRYVHRAGQLHNQLSGELPGLVAEAARRVLGELLDSRGLSSRSIRHWAIHPGGEKILKALGAALALSDAQLQVSRAVLSEYGNVSSASIGFVLQRLLERGIPPGEWCAVLTFGAGLSCHGLLLRMAES
ncbi:MAG: type III polyketide synthase [Deltaproteobacteria bacterium]|nr:type III polyketide synthase [Deltaproteobacteria bacterium]